MTTESGKSTLRVAQIVRPAEGGIRRHVSLLTSALNPKLFSTSVYAPADFTLDNVAAHIPLYPLAIAPRTNVAADLRAIRTLAQQLRGNADLIHAHGLRAALIGVLAAKRAGIPSLFTAHNLTPPMNGLQRGLFRLIGRSAQRILAVSQAVADTLTAAGLPPAKINVVPNGIPLADFDRPDATDIRRQWNIPPDAPLVVGIGRLSPEKGFPILVGAFYLVLSTVPKAHLLIAGDGPERDKIESIAADFKSHCRFIGFAEDVVSILRAADVVAIPSLLEGQGLVALEAMAARKPVVARRIGGLVETIVPNVTGVLVPPSEDIPAFASALASLLQSPDRCQKMGLAGRQKVEQCCSLERMINNIETIYQAIVGETHRVSDRAH